MIQLFSAKYLLISNTVNNHGPYISTSFINLSNLAFFYSVHNFLTSSVLTHLSRVHFSLYYICVFSNSFKMAWPLVVLHQLFIEAYSSITSNSNKRWSSISNICQHSKRQCKPLKIVCLDYKMLLLMSSTLWEIILV